MTLRPLRPDLYRENAFRVTGLPVRATPRDLRRHVERQRLMGRLGRSEAGQGVLPPPTPPDEDAAQRAVQRLKDPLERLMDELFWLWPAEDGDGDPAMAALREGRPQEALRLWETGPAGPVATHNIAVLAHVQALEADDLGPQTLRSWKRAYEHWAKVIGDDAFWELMTARAAELDDPRLTAATVRDLRADLPTALLSISAQLTATAVRDGRSADAREHTGLMYASGFPGGAADDALRSAVDPEISRIETLCANAGQTLVGDPAHGDEVAERLLDAAEPLLDVLYGVLPGGHWTARNAGDDVAKTALGCVVSYANREGDHERAIDLLLRVLATAGTDSVRERVEENLEIIRGNLGQTHCFFCSRPADPDRPLEMKMHGEVRQVAQGLRVTWKTVTISVPRCAGCRVRIYRHVLAIVLFIPLLIATVIAFIMEAAFTTGLAVLTVLIGAFGLRSGPRRPVIEYEPIADLSKNGWRFGDRPRGV
ncbi:hypothetical protein DP939_30430 [Spongiactinospora rosea]|uniref:Uncharacterized protein n=1 Tax=Spongiactinospora rosea TaxID=2248750 RepID=A0A366LR38_9ACTN|nr:hypothetical protein [Spongiactinospora rosea]RBQ16287.1 hypothetical protein DP939_30430 [Spongiactinospora rosea]